MSEPESFGPSLPAMKYRDDFEALASHSIGNHVWCSGNDEFARSRYAARAADVRQIRQAVNRAQERRGHAIGGAGILVRDERTQLGQVSDGARHTGRTVKFAKTVDQAIALARTERAVMIVADVQCREVDCLEVARQAKADAGLRSVPILGFVSHVQEEAKRAALTAGFDKVVAKSTFSDKARELMAG